MEYSAISSSPFRSAVSRAGHAHAPLQYRLCIQSLEETDPALAGEKLRASIFIYPVSVLPGERNMLTKGLWVTLS